MPGMNATYRNLIANAGAAAATHIGLVDGSGNELAGGDPAYARQPVTWTTASDGTIRPNTNLTFDVPAGSTVAGWRAFSALTEGTNYDGKALEPESFAGQGQYTLLAAETAIRHDGEA